MLRASLTISVLTFRLVGRDYGLRIRARFGSKLRHPTLYIMFQAREVTKMSKLRNKFKTRVIDDDDDRV